MVVSYLVGGREGGWAKDFMEDGSKRISNNVQITTRWASRIVGLGEAVLDETHPEGCTGHLRDFVRFREPQRLVFDGFE